MTAVQPYAGAAMIEKQNGVCVWKISFDFYVVLFSPRWVSKVKLLIFIKVKYLKLLAGCILYKSCLLVLRLFLCIVTRLEKVKIVEEPAVYRSGM